MRTLMSAALIALSLCASLPARALDLTVTHFGEGMYGVPFAVAREKGFFKEAGLDVTGFLSSAGGGTTVRNALASEIPYGEVALPAALAAYQQGVDLRIVHAGAINMADLLIVVRKGEEMPRTLEDLKGKVFGYSTPKSSTDMISLMVLDAAGLGGQVERKAVGSIGPMMTALREKAVDAAFSAEPIWSRDRDKYRLLLRSSDRLGPMTQTVGIVRADYLRANAAKIRAIIAARRRGVEFVRLHPDEAAAITARAYKLDPQVVRTAIDGLLGSSGQYWSLGGIDRDGLAATLKGLQLVQAVDAGPFDWSKIIDESVLPDPGK